MESYIDQIKKIVSDSQGVTVSDFDLKTNKRKITQCRFFVFYFAKNYLRYSLAECGNIFRQDHATALHGITVIDGLKDYTLKVEFEDMERRVQDIFKHRKPSVYSKNKSIARQKRSLLFRSGVKR